MAINDREPTTTTTTTTTTNFERTKKKEKHTITLAEVKRKKTTHIAFINIIKSLCAAAILNSTAFFFSASFSLSLFGFLYVYAERPSSLCCCYFCMLVFFPSIYCITKATLPLLMFRIPMFFFLFFNLFRFFFVRFILLPLLTIR